MLHRCFHSANKMKNRFGFLLQSGIIFPIIGFIFVMIVVLPFHFIVSNNKVLITEITEQEYEELKKICIDADVVKMYNEALLSDYMITNEEKKSIIKRIEGYNKIKKHLIYTY